MTENAFFDDLWKFHRWANAKLLATCEGLSDEALDASRPLGPGSLRKTLVHMVGAERIWLERWQRKTPSTFPTDEEWSLSEIESRFLDIDHGRVDYFSAFADGLDDVIVDYQNLRGDPFHHRLTDLMLHVLNHAVHHRSQAIHFLRHQGKKIPGGLDYIFYKMANPTVSMLKESANQCRAFGLEIGADTVPFLGSDGGWIRRFSVYGDWATKRILESAALLTDEQLDHDWSMGMGSLRKTLLHLYDAECWWQLNWANQVSRFPNSPESTSIVTLQERWEQMALRRLRWLDESEGEKFERVVAADFGAGKAHFRVSESMIQLCVHGTLHRAQANNMLKSLGLSALPLDYVIWLREQMQNRCV